MKKSISILFLLSMLLFPKDYALIVGISGYKNIGTLSHIESDIETYKNILNQRGINRVTILTNAQATRAEIRNYLAYVMEDMKRFKNNRFFMFFAGHGIDTKYLEYDEQILKSGVEEYLTDSGVFLPYEYDERNIPNTIIIGKRDLRPYLIEIDKYIQESLIIFDACYSGNIIRGEKRITPFIYSNSKDYPYKNIVYIASATPKEKGESGVLSVILNKCITQNTHLEKLRVCMNNELKSIGQRVTLISK